MLVYQLNKQRAVKKSHHMFNPTVFSLCVFSDGDQVNIRVRGLVALNGYTGAHIGIEVKCFPQQQVHRWMTGSYWRLQWTCRLFFKMTGSDSNFTLKQMNYYNCIKPVNLSGQFCSCPLIPWHQEESSTCRQVLEWL